MNDENDNAATDDPPKCNLPLHDAIDAADTERVRKLLEHGADANAPGLRGLPPLHLAIDSAYNTNKIIELLLQHGADATLPDALHGDTPFHIASRSTFPWMVEQLLAAGADINALNKAGQTPMDVAFLHRQLGQYIDLLERGGKRAVDLAGEATTPPLPATDEEAWRHYPRTTALHRSAAWNICRDIDDLLDQQGMDINARAAGGNTPLHFAVLSRRKEAAEHLLTRGADVNARGANGQSPLVMAVRDASLNMCRLLLAHGADISLADNDGHDAMYWVEHIPLPDFCDASEYPVEAIRSLLVRHGGVPAPAPPMGWYDKNDFCHWELRSVAETVLALAMGMTVDDRDWWDGDTLLHWAVFTGKPHVAHYLLEHGADPNTWGEGNHDTPLMDAASRGFCDVVLLLLEYGADPYRCVDGRNALDYCADFPHIAALMRTRGAD